MALWFWEIQLGCAGVDSCCGFVVVVFGVYSHLKELSQLDFIEHQNVGRIKIYNTTEKFRKYFGIQGDDDTLRQKLKKS